MRGALYPSALMCTMISMITPEAYMYIKVGGAKQHP